MVKNYKMIFQPATLKNFPRPLTESVWVETLEEAFSIYQSKGYKWGKVFKYGSLKLVAAYGNVAR